jgi:hypothetical protein
VSVRLRHPDLPEDQTITVPDQAARWHRAAGWELVDTPEPETRSGFADAMATANDAPSPAPIPAAETAPETAPDNAPRRRSTKEAEK